MAVSVYLVDLAGDDKEKKKRGRLEKVLKLIKVSSHHLLASNLTYLLIEQPNCTSIRRYAYCPFNPDS